MRYAILFAGLGLAFGIGGCKTAPNDAAEGPRSASGPPTPYLEPVAFRNLTENDYEKLVVKVEIPAQPEGTGGLGGCPKAASNKLLGIEIGAPHGIVVAKVEPGGPADKAGIKVGDSIIACNGQETSCPSSLRPLLGAGRQSVTVELTIRRPKTAPDSGEHPKPSAAPAPDAAK